MAKIEIIKKISVSPVNLHLLNVPFPRLVREWQEKRKNGKDDDLFLGHHRFSGYHDPMDVRSQGIWKVYPFLEGFGKISVVIAKTSDTIKLSEMLEFMRCHWGFALSRDNLFALWEVYRKELQELADTDKELAILAPGALGDFPEHLNGFKIYPVLVLKKGQGPEYDWTRIDDIRAGNGNGEVAFAFFRFHVPLMEMDRSVWC